MRHGRYGYMRSVPRPETWATLQGTPLEELRKEFVYRVGGILILLHERENS